MDSSIAAVVEIPQDSDFTLDNLPYGVFSVPPGKTQRLGVAIGGHVLDLSRVRHLFDGPLMKEHQQVFESSVLNEFMGLSHRHWSEARATIRSLLTSEKERLPSDALIPMEAVTLHLPANIGEFLHLAYVFQQILFLSLIESYEIARELLCFAIMQLLPISITSLLEHSPE
jgi:hypothetical protein